MGFAVVDVNMRGTGCSGGAFDFFEPLQNLDGYDVIETIAHQPWVLRPQGRDDGHLLRRHQPAVHGPARPAGPRGDLAAVGDRRDRDDALPGRHPQHRLRGRVGAAAPAGGRARRARTAVSRTPYKQIQRRRHDVRGQPGAARRGRQPDARRSPPTRTTTRRSPTRSTRSRSCNKIKVPTFMACQWEDEQTGGHCPDLAQHFTGTTQKWFTFTNGAHIDSLDPYTFNRWYDFLELFVAHQAPIVNPAVIARRGAGHLPGGDGAAETDVDHAAARPDPAAADVRSRRWPRSKQLPQIRVLFDNGAGAVADRARTTPGDPYPGFEQSFSSFPIPGTKARYWYLGPGGTLSDKAAATGRASTPTPPTPRRCRSTDYRANTGTGGLWGNASAVGMELAAEPGRHRRVLRVGAARSEHDGDRRAARSTCGCGPRRPTSTCRRRSARCARTATRRSCRTAGCAPASASSPRPRTTCSSRSQHAARADPDACSRPTCSRCPTGEFVEVVDPAVLRGARLPRGLAHQGRRSPRRTARSRSGRSARREPKRHGDRVDRVLARACRRA